MAQVARRVFGGPLDGHVEKTEPQVIWWEPVSESTGIAHIYEVDKAGDFQYRYAARPEPVEDET